MSREGKYRKKPIEIEAFQVPKRDWTVDMNWEDRLVEWSNHLVRIGVQGDGETRYHEVYDRLHDTWVTFEDGDWVIKGVQGEFYPCKDDVFRATYDFVPDVVGKKLGTRLDEDRRCHCGSYCDPGHCINVPA